MEGYSRIVKITESEFHSLLYMRPNLICEKVTMFCAEDCVLDS